MGMLRLCVAASVGLFDSSVNYIWNSTIIELRRKVAIFGVGVVAQIIGSQFDEAKLNDLKDYDLLKLCWDLNLVSEDAYFMLDQCRAIRNNFSAAHPTMGDIDEYEVINFISRCAKHALSQSESPSGVRIAELMTAIKGAKFTDEQEAFWKNKIAATHFAQKTFLITTLHGIYCDDTVGQNSRQNCLDLVEACVETDQQFVDVISNHQKYMGLGDTKKSAASRDFLTKIGKLILLSQGEVHEVFDKDCKRLIAVHQAFDNFYNETPFAERLAELASKTPLPDTMRASFVYTVIMCSVGNAYGTSLAADEHYKAMIANFTAAEIADMLSIPNGKNIVASRISNHARCRGKFKALVALLDPKAIPTSLANEFKKWA